MMLPMDVTRVATEGEMNRDPKQAAGRWALRALVLCALLASASGCEQVQRNREMTVVGTDYRFQVPATVPAGLTLLGFENRGRVDHEVIVARLKPGTTLQQAHEAQRRGADPAETTDEGAGVLFADAGRRSAGKLLIDLAPGRSYVIICLFRDFPQAPPHAEMGMIASFTVQQ